MRISTKLTITAMLPAAMALAVGAILFVSLDSLATLEKQDRSAHRISESMSELNDLARSYVLRHEERTRQQFMRKHRETTERIAVAAFEDREQRRILDRISKRTAAIGSLFLKLVSNHERHGSARDDALLREAEERLVGQLAIRSRDAKAEASSLVDRINQDIVPRQRRIYLLALAVMFVAIVPVILVLFGLTRSVAASLERLRRGTEMIGTGSLDHRIGVSSKDEIGELSQAFDRMAGKLEATTVSRDRLAGEVEERKKTEAALEKELAERSRAEKRARRLASFPQLNPNPVIEVDASGKVVFFNPATRRCLEGLGMEREEVRVFLPGDMDRILGEWDRKKEAVLQREITVKDRVFAVTVFLSSEFDVARLYSLEITERKRTEEALRKSEERLKRAQEIAHLGSWELDAASGKLTWSDEVYRIFGLQPLEFDATYEGFLDAVHPDDRAAVDAAYSGSLIEGRSAYEIEHRVVRRSDGAIRIVHEKCEHLRDESGGILRSVGMVHDITERKRAEEEVRAAKEGLELRVAERTAELSTLAGRLQDELMERTRIEQALRESEERFRALVEHSPVGVFIVRNGRIVYRNPEQMRLFGAMPEEFLLHAFPDVYPEDAEKFETLCAELCLKGQAAQELDFRFYPYGKSAEGLDLRWVQVRTIPMEYGGEQAVLVSMVDITRLKEMEYQFLIREKMASLGHVAAGIAHEIRNPLSGINIHLSSLERIHEHTAMGAEERAQAEGMVRQIQSASDRIESVIRKVMDFSRPSAVRTDKADITQAIENAIDFTSTQLRRERILLDRSRLGILPKCPADPPMITQVMMNLIVNAAQAMQNTGGEKVIGISSFVEGDRIVICVSDSGPGIPTSIRDRIFDPFYTTRQDGYGIGLSFCRRVISEHGGSLTVNASALGGAEFRIELSSDGPGSPRTGPQDDTVSVR